jgi:hypothetical protein
MRMRRRTTAVLPARSRTLTRTVNEPRRRYRWVAERPLSRAPSPNATRIRPMPDARRPDRLASVARTRTRTGRPRRRVPVTRTVARGSVASCRSRRIGVAVTWPLRSVAMTRQRCAPSGIPAGSASCWAFVCPTARPSSSSV